MAAAVARSHGIDSGARLPDDTIDVDVSPQDTPRTRCLKQLLVSTRHDIAGDRASALSALHAAQETALGAADTLADLDLLGNLANAALHLGDDDAHRHFYALMLSTARENGNGMAVLYALQRVPFSQFVGGQWTALRNSSEEAVTLGLSVGQVAATAASRAWLTLLAALEGRPDYDERLTSLEALLAVHPPVGILAQPVEDLTRWAKGIRALLGGDANGALHQFRQMTAASSPIQLPALMLMSAQDRIDAAVRSDDLTQALAWVEDLDAFAAGTALPWAQAAAAFGRAVSSEHDGAGWPKPGHRAVRDSHWHTMATPTVPTTVLGSSWRTASSCAATCSESTPAVSSGQHWRRSRTCTPARSLNGPARNSELPGRRPANGTRPRR